MIKLDVVKEHLRVTHDDEDALIERILAAATRRVSDDIQQTLLPEGSAETDGIVINEAIHHAILLTVGDLYENRESGTMSGRRFVRNPTYDRLLAPYRKGMGV